MKERIKSGGELFGPACWEGGFAPLARNTTVPFNNALEAMPTAAGLIMQRGKLLDANRSLLAVLREGDGLVKVNDRVVFQEPSEQRVFQRRLAVFFQTGGLRAPVAMRVSRRDSDEPYFIRVSSLQDHQQATWDSDHIGVLTVAQPTVSPVVNASLLMEFLELTQAEAEVSIALAAGQTIASIAVQRGVKTSTVYANIKNISEKSGYNGASEIARRVCDLARIFGSR
ncbi:MAG: hypothetical protein WCJ64_23380 [Rhodospirillaceae bacterium]